MDPYLRATVAAHVCGFVAGLIAYSLGAREWSFIVALVAACAAAWVASDDAR